MGFTAISTGIDWQHVDIANEFVNAMSERSQAIGGFASTAVSAGDDIQSVAFWKTLQDWLEDNCDEFVEHEEVANGMTSIPYYTLSSWRTEAAIDSGGFRRSTDGTTFSYGKIQEGDIIGPWIFEELQQGFDVLRWTVKTATNRSFASYESKTATGTGSSRSAAYEDASWPSAWSSQSSGNNMLYRAWNSMTKSGATYTVSLNRRRASMDVGGIPNHISHIASAYLFMMFPIGNPSYSYYFEDIDALYGESPVEDSYVSVQNFTSATTTSRTVGPLSYDSKPPDISPGPATDGTELYGIIALEEHESPWYSEVTLVLKWDFTETL